MGAVKILIADDHDAVRRSIRDFMAPYPSWMICGEARDGLEAVEKTKLLQPDIVLMDMGMPQMDGIRATRIIQKESPQTAVLIISQNDMNMMKKEAASLGVSGYIEKSRLSQELLPALEALAVKDARRNGRASQASSAEAGARTSAAELECVVGGGKMGELEHKLRLDAELLASIVASSDDAIISKSLDGIITSWNRSAERMFGYRAEEAIGQPITLIIPRDRHAEEAQILGRLRRGERVDHFETVRVRKDGTTFDLSLTISPVKDSRGRVIGASKVARDISERKKIESALRQSEERFRTLSERLDAEVRARTQQLEERNADILRQAELLRELAHRLLQAQDDERRRIARELHDSAGQTLTVLGMNLAQLVQNAGRSSPHLASDAEKIQQTVQQLHREIRTASYLLHPPLLDEAGLDSALTWYIDGLGERSGLEIRLDIPADFGRLPRDIELMAFRLVQECLTNIHRHSGSKTAAISIARQTDQITVEIRDSGKGMSAEKLAEVQTRGSGVGIRGMRERVRQFNGKLDIQSSSSGTRIFVSIPSSANELRKEQDETEPLQAAI